MYSLFVITFFPQYHIMYFLLWIRFSYLPLIYYLTFYGVLCLENFWWFWWSFAWYVLLYTSCCPLIVILLTMIDITTVHKHSFHFLWFFSSFSYILLRFIQHTSMCATFSNPLRLIFWHWFISHKLESMKQAGITSIFVL